MEKSINIIDGKFWEKCDIVMLPTEKATDISVFKGSEGIYYRARTNSRSIFQHLYILSNEEIKKGDWKYCFNTHTVLQCHKIEDLCNECKKIITTTDNLQIPFQNNISTETMSRPSNEFIKKYCELGGLDKVMVMYTSYEIESNEIGHCEVECKMYLKVAPDNTITIKQL